MSQVCSCYSHGRVQHYLGWTCDLWIMFLAPFPSAEHCHQALNLLGGPQRWRGPCCGLSLRKESEYCVVMECLSKLQPWIPAVANSFSLHIFLLCCTEVMSQGTASYGSCCAFPFINVFPFTSKKESFHLLG